MPVTVTTELPDTPTPSFDTQTEDQIDVSWPDVTDYGDYVVEFKRASLSSWFRSYTAGQGASSLTIDPTLTRDTRASAAPADQQSSLEAFFTTNGENLAHKFDTIYWTVANISDVQVDAYVTMELRDSAGNAIRGKSDSRQLDPNSSYTFVFTLTGWGLDPNTDYSVYGEVSGAYADSLEGQWYEDLLDGEPYDVRLRVKTEHVVNEWVSDTPVAFLPAPTMNGYYNVSKFGADIDFTDESDNESGFYLQRRREYEDGWGPWKTVKDISPISGSKVYSKVVTDDTALPGETYEYRAQSYTQ